MTKDISDNRIRDTSQRCISVIRPSPQDIFSRCLVSLPRDCQIFSIAVLVSFILFPLPSNSHPAGADPTIAIPSFLQRDEYAVRARSALHLSALQHPQSPRQCGFMGNNDIYGLGIRTGIYTQTIAVWFSKYFLLSQAYVLRDSITVFSIALLAVALVFVRNASQTYAVEGFILLQILSWSCLTGVRTKTSYAKQNLRNSVTRLLFTESLNIASLGLHVWFWFRGLDEMLKTPCGTFTMFLVKVNVYGWFRTVMKFFAVFGLADYVYTALLEAIRVWSYTAMRHARDEFEKAAIGFIEESMLEGIYGRQGASSIAATPHGSTEVVTSDSSMHSLAGSVKQSESRRSSIENISVDRQETLLSAKDSPSLNPVNERDPENIQTSEDTTPPQCERSPYDSQIIRQSSLAREEFQNESVKDIQRPQYERHRCPILEDVYNGEIYLKHCLAARPSNQLVGRQAFLYKSLMRVLLIPSPKYTDSPTTTGIGAESNIVILPSYLTCDLRIFKALVTLRFPGRAAALYTHLRRAYILEPWNGPYQVYAAIAYPSTLPQNANKATVPSASGASLASSLMILASRKKKKSGTGRINATIDLSIHIFVILQLEFTIRWNVIEGLVGLGSVGQLIPFIIGVAGLVLVGVRWVEGWRRRHRRKSMEKGHSEEVAAQSDQEGGIDRLDRSAVEGYLRWKKAHEAWLESQDGSDDRP